VVIFRHLLDVVAVVRFESGAVLVFVHRVVDYVCHSACSTHQQLEQPLPKNPCSHQNPSLQNVYSLATLNGNDVEVYRMPYHSKSVELEEIWNRVLG
jgi:hypothetical protein